MAIEYNFTLDMDRSKRDNNIAYARTGDVDSITINADLVLNGAAYTPTGTDAFFECVTPNGHSIRAAAQKTGSSVSVEVPSAAFQAAGVINVAYFRFETGEADNPTYVESTEPFAIVVREGIGDDIDAGDYIEEWRGLADQLEAVVAEVEQKAEQAGTAINEQKTEVDQLKAQAQVSIAQDVEDVSDAKDTAISNINGSQGAVDAAIEQLEQKTQEAVDAAQDALDGTLATNLKNAIDRTLKLDVADMTDIQDSTSLSSLTAVGSYCCKTATSAATIGDSPINDSPFNMYVFSSADSGQVMQLVIPIDNQDKSTAEWHVRFGTSSAMDQWSVIGGGGGGMPDIVPVSQGGTGVTTAAAERNRLGLGNTTGALPVANGGTGATDAKAAQYSLLNGMAESTDDASDTSKFIMEAGSPSAAAGAVAKRSASYVWNWIVTKIRSTFGFDSSNVLTVAKGGTGGRTASQARTNLDVAKGIATSTYQSLTGSTDVTSSLSSTVHTRFTLNDLLAWLKEQGLGGSQDDMVAGVIYPYTGSTIPNGFLLCDGAAVSRTTYSKLFDAIGTTYGSGDGSTTFNLPNLKQRMLIGSGDGMQTGSTGGSNTHQHEYGVMFGEYYSDIVKPLRTYDYDTSAASDNVVYLGKTPAGTQVNAGAQEGNKNPPISLPFEFVAYGKTKKSDSLPQYLVVNYIISTGEVDATARSDGLSIEYPISIEKGGTGSTSAKAAQNSLLNDMNVSSDALTDSSMLVGYNASPSASNGAVHKRSVSTIWDYIASKVADKVWEQIKTKAVRSDTTTGTDLTLVGGLESTSQTRTSTLTLGINEMSLDNSNAAPLTVNGEEVITESSISSHLPATFDAKSVWFSTPLKQGQQKNIVTEGGFTLAELRKYFVPGNLVLANMVCGGDHGVQYEVVVPMVITLGDGMVMQPTGITYNSIADAHFDCIFAVANNEQAGDSGGTGLADGVTLLYSVTEVPGYANRTSTSSLKGFTVFDVVSHAI